MDVLRHWLLLVDVCVFVSIYTYIYTYIYIYYSSVCNPQEPYGSSNGGLPAPMWGCDLCSNGHGRHPTRITIQLAFWQIYDNVILIMSRSS
jgi:hypothetical protein